MKNTTLSDSHLEKRTKTFLEYLPFTDISSSENNVVDSSDFFLARLKTSEREYKIVNGKSTTISNHESNSLWGLISKDNLESFLKKPKNSLNALFENPTNRKGSYVILSEEEYHQIKKDNTFQPYQESQFVSPQFRSGYNDKFISEDKKYIIAQFFRVDSKLFILKIGKDEYVSNGFEFSDSYDRITDEKWDIENLLLSILDNEQIKFFIKERRNSPSVEVDKKDPSQTKRIIRTGYNSNDDAYEFFSFTYYPNSDQLKRIVNNIHNELNSLNFHTSFEGEIPKTLTEKEYKDIFYSAFDHILVKCLGAAEFNKSYQQLLIEKKLVDNKPKSSISRIR